MTESTTQKTFSVRNVWQDSPGAYKVGIVLAVLGWFVGISSSSYSTANGTLTACSYLDYAKIGIGAVVVVLAVVGFLANARTPRHNLPTALSGLVTAALLVVGVLLVLRGLAVYPGCAAQITVK